MSVIDELEKTSLADLQLIYETQKDRYSQEELDAIKKAIDEKIEHEKLLNVLRKAEVKRRSQENKTSWRYLFPGWTDIMFVGLYVVMVLVMYQLAREINGFFFLMIFLGTILVFLVCMLTMIIVEMPPSEFKLPSAPAKKRSGQNCYTPNCPLCGSINVDKLSSLEQYLYWRACRYLSLFDVPQYRCGSCGFKW